MLKSYSLRHERGDEPFLLLKAYRDAVNSVLEELWNSIEWKKRKVNGKKRVELKMEGASQKEWWDNVVLPSLLGGCVLTGAERKTPNELLRGLHEVVKPKLYAYDRYADTYLRTPTWSETPIIIHLYTMSRL